MFRRPPYRPIQQPEKTPTSVSQNADVEELKGVIVESMETMAKNMEEFKKMIKEMNEKMEALDERQSKIEKDVDTYHVISGMTGSGISEIRRELQALRQNSQSVRSCPHAQDSREEGNNGREMEKPMMPGTGFANITPEYLRRLKNNE